MLLAVAATAVVIAFAATRAEKSKAARAAGPAVRYTCAMHPQVASPGPGECPICRMALERVETAAAPAETRAADAGAVPAQLRRHVGAAAPRAAGDARARLDRR